MPRRRSLMKDKADNNQFHFHRDSNLGVSVSNEWYQQPPMFFTRENAQLNLIGHYRGASAFLICNGPSFAKLDHSQLRRPGVITYGMNNGAKSFRPAFWTCVDDPKRFMKSVWLDPSIMKIVPHSFSEKKLFDNQQWQDIKTTVGDCPNMVYFHRNEKFMANRFLFEDTMNWGNHKNYGGGRTVLLPVLRIMFLLGFRKVYLLGADFTMSADYTYHFDEQRAKGAVKGNNNTYERLMKEYLPQLKPYFEEEGFKIYNCNPDSKLKVFPHISYEDAIAEATAKLGDVDNERTWGLYSKPEERQKWKEEPPEEQKHHLSNIDPTWQQRHGAEQNQDTEVEETPPVENMEHPKKPTAEDAQKEIPVPPSFTQRSTRQNETPVKVERYEDEMSPSPSSEESSSSSEEEMPPPPKVNIPQPPPSMAQHITIEDNGL